MSAENHCMMDAVCIKNINTHVTSPAIEWTYRFYTTNHESRAQNRHVEVVQTLLLLRQEQRLNQTVGYLFSTLHPFVNVGNHASVCFDQIGVQFLSASLQRQIKWELLEYGHEIDHVRDGAGAVPVNQRL